MFIVVDRMLMWVEPVPLRFVMSCMLIWFLSAPVEGPEQQPSNNWKGYFNVYSYAQYFNVDTDVVLNRLMSSLYPTTGDFFSKIDANPDL